MRDNQENYKDTCTVHCTDKDKDLSADVLSFKPGKSLIVVVSQELRITMSYVPKHKIYVGTLSGLEFTTKGPASSF